MCCVHCEAPNPQMWAHNAGFIPFGWLNEDKINHLSARLTEFTGLSRGEQRACVVLSLLLNIKAGEAVGCSGTPQAYKGRRG